MTDQSRIVRFFYAPRMRILGIVTTVLAILFSIVSLTGLAGVYVATEQTEAAHERYQACTTAATDMLSASDYLTTRARMYVLTGRMEYLDAYFKEMLTTDRRSKAVDTLEGQIGDHEALELLKQANDESNQLATVETYALRLAADSYDVTPMPEELQRVRLSDEDAALPSDDKLHKAEAMLLGSEYEQKKASIVDKADACLESLMLQLKTAEDQSAEHLSTLINTVTMITILSLVLVSLDMVIVYWYLINPMMSYAASIRKAEPLHLTGAEELQTLAASYNAMYEETNRRAQNLKREAEHDALTGLLNRGSFDAILATSKEDVALLIVDVDLFKQVNDTYGHEMGDAVLRRVADALQHAFRSSDYVFRIGGDEFAVIMTEMHKENRSVIVQKVRWIAAGLRNPAGEVPGATLSIGIAWASDLGPHESLFKAADAALYGVKEAGRDGYAFEDEHR